MKVISNKAKLVKLKICEKVSDFIKQNFIEDIKYFENKNKIKFEIISDNSLVVPEYIIDFQNKSKKVLEKIESIKTLKNLDEIKKENKNNKSVKLNKKKKFYKKKFFKKKIK